MKTAEEILKTNTGHAHGLMDAMVIKSMNEYALEACKETLRNASENANVKIAGMGYIVIDHSTILSEDNIPQEVKE